MKYLVDVNVLSEPTKPKPISSVVDWLRTRKPDLAVNPVILGELEYGILLLPASRRRSGLIEWLEYGAARMRVLDLDRDTARIWANLTFNLRRKGRTMPTTDSLIAATALQHGLTVATRNTVHYRHCGVRIVNPFND